MKKVMIIIAVHVVGIGLLTAIGLRLNAVISEKYAGLVTVYSLAVGVYTTVLSVLYQRSYAFHLFVNRLRLKFARTHTFWLPHFRFGVAGPQENAADFLDGLWGLFKKGMYGRPVRRDRTVTTLVVALDDLLVVKFRVENGFLSVSFEQRLLVPSHLYDDYRRRLAKLAEDVAKIVHPTSTTYGIQVSFGDGARNPYYGFFVNRVPASLLQDFQVTFRLAPHSDCRIEAGTDHVNVEAASLTDTFEALNQVLRLRALPKGA